ncbi:hypothetical protein [Brevundimonas sp.]|uniref:hypothetical protein n=1 Tax=Brevundimonas sp. TaxID=1871086 RepID=UPI002FCBD027
MILTAIAALVLQTPADLPAAIPALRDWCARPGSGSGSWATGDGHSLQVRRGPSGCGLFVQPVRGDEGALVRAVEEALAPAAQGWYPVRRRELVVNESGPMRWSEYEHRIAGSLLLIEPAEGQVGTVTLEIHGGD